MGTFRGNVNPSGTRYAPPEPRETSIGLVIGPQRSLNGREAEYFFASEFFVLEFLAFTVTPCDLADAVTPFTPWPD